MREIRLCLTGLMRSGKSTAGDYLAKKYKAMPFAFGNELKERFHQEYPHIPRTPKPRKGYQLYGQLMRFVHGEDYWLDKCFKEIDRIREAAKGYGSEEFIPMITDARQPNEFEECRKRGFHIIKIVAPLDLRVHRAKESGDLFDMEDFYHETETYVQDCKANFVISNQGTVEELYDQLDIVMRKIINYEKWKVNNG